MLVRGSINLKIQLNLEHIPKRRHLTPETLSQPCMFIAPLLIIAKSWKHPRFCEQKNGLKNVQCFILWGITRMLKTVKLLSKWKEPEKNHPE